jgi:hypothetical protein
MTDDRRDLPEPDFTPKEFDQTKYTEHFPALQAAYKDAFEEINDRHDSELVHAIDQQVLNESEPFYSPEGGFEVDCTGRSGRRHRRRGYRRRRPRGVRCGHRSGPG